MNVKVDKNEIWKWYEILQDYETSDMKQKAYCDYHNLPYKKFTNMRYRLIYKKHTNPELYEKLFALGKKYLNSSDMAAKFAKAHGIRADELSDVGTHIGYLNIVEEIKREKEIQPMNFIQVPAVQPKPMAEEAEIVEKQNDLEIIISKGVKVSISPNVDSITIIKIIELLKDL